MLRATVCPARSASGARTEIWYASVASCQARGLGPYTAGRQCRLPLGMHLPWDEGTEDEAREMGRQLRCDPEEAIAAGESPHQIFPDWLEIAELSPADKPAISKISKFRARKLHLTLHPP
jgi:hypothetical protein